MNNPRVLIADDNEILVKRVAEHLASSFKIVGVAHDGQDLVAKTLDLAPDVVVADIAMPLLTGIEAVHQLRKSGLGTRLVFLTVHSEDEFLNACLEEGALGYVAKSRMTTDLIPALHSVMAGKLFISPSLSTRRP